VFSSNKHFIHISTLILTDKLLYEVENYNKHSHAGINIIELIMPSKSNIVFACACMCVQCNIYKY